MSSSCRPHGTLQDFGDNLHFKVDPSDLFIIGPTWPHLHDALTIAFTGVVDVMARSDQAGDYGVR